MLIDPEKYHHNFLKRRKCMTCDLLLVDYLKVEYAPCIDGKIHHFRSDYRSKMIPKMPRRARKTIKK